jgi:hypothetical protein
VGSLMAIDKLPLSRKFPPYRKGRDDWEKWLEDFLAWNEKNYADQALRINDLMTRVKVLEGP